MRSLLGTVRAVLRVLPEGTRRFVWTYSLLSAALALLDVVALGLLAYVLPQALGNEDRAVRLPGVGQLAGTGDLIVLGVGISLLFIMKSIAAMLLTLWGVRRFARHEISLADRLMRAYLLAPWVHRLQTSSARVVRNMDVGLSMTFNGLLMPYSSLVAEAASFAAVAAVIVVAQPLTAATAIGYFGFVGLLLYRVLSRRGARNGRIAADTSARTVQLVQEAMTTMKEVTLRGQEQHLAEVVHDVRSRSATARSQSFFFGVAPRYVLEAALMGGFLVVGGVAAVGGGASSAISAVALFAAAGFRVVPSLTRFQAVLATMHANEAYAREIVEDLSRAEFPLDDSAGQATGQNVTPFPSGPVDLELRDVVFRYPDARRAALDSVTLTIPAGCRVAFVGRSGSGKTTLADVILSLLVPQEGVVQVGGVPINSMLAGWRRRVGYVPQDVALFDASIAQNVALTWRPEDVDETRVWQALAASHLTDVVEGLPGRLDARVGERGLRLSGGQRQRLGIARALYGRPQVLVLDEATSALDTATEAEITDTIAGLGPEVTVITVAHRLSTIRESDLVVLLESGRIRAMGRFEEVVAAVPDFAVQASLAGLGERRESAP